jgi:RNA polymerase sigma-70 factor (ECF subfamily)
MDYSKLDDEILIRLIAVEQADSLAELYDRYSRLIFSLAVNIVGDSATAEEITLDVFTQVWEKAEMYQPEMAKVNTWLTNIARNRSIDILRRRGARRDGHHVDWFSLSPDQLSTNNNPEESAALSLIRKRVRRAVSELPEDQKEALSLSYFKGYSHRQIAEKLNQPLGTVKTRIYLAMKKLRSMLVDEESGSR